MLNQKCNYLLFMLLFTKNSTRCKLNTHKDQQMETQHSVQSEVTHPVVNDDVWNIGNTAAVQCLV